MSDNPTRKGTREKKPPKHFDFDADFGNYSAPRPTDPRDRLNPAQENNQLAKLLCRFLQSCNQKYRDSHQPNLPDRNRPNENIPDNEPKKEQTHKRAELRSAQRDNESAGPQKRGKQTAEKQGAEGRVGSRSEGVRKNGNSGRGNSTLNPAIQSDLAYHSILNQHIRNNYPDINHISAEMLSRLEIPHQPHDQPHPAPRPKPNPPKDLRNPPKTPKETELKPFKRQSYHVAIAYHIHIKMVKAKNGSEQEVDPTYNARKLRDDAQRQNQNQSQSQSQNQDRKPREDKERDRSRKEEDRRR